MWPDVSVQMDGWSGWQCHERSEISLKGRVEPGKDLSSGVNWPDM